jgi:hypothetical protein
LKYALSSFILGILNLDVVRKSSDAFKFWHEAMMTGYFWDATIQKIKEGLR